MMSQTYLNKSKGLWVFPFWNISCATFTDADGPPSHLYISQEVWGFAEWAVCIEELK